jgi:hypothetical protein
VQKLKLNYIFYNSMSQQNQNIKTGAEKTFPDVVGLSGQEAK